jgi:hypothetical protein
MNVRRIAKAVESRGTSAAAETQAVSSFLRGLTAGALIGAAIAGSAILQRRRGGRGHKRESGDKTQMAGDTEIEGDSSPSPDN